VTGREFAKKDSYPAKLASRPGRASPGSPGATPRFTASCSTRRAKIAWGRSDIGGDPIVVVLTEQVADAHLDALRDEGVSTSLPASASSILALLLEILNREPASSAAARRRRPRQRLVLRAGLVDEISLAIVPAVDGARRAARGSIRGPNWRRDAPLTDMVLKECTVQDGGARLVALDVRNANWGAVSFCARLEQGISRVAFPHP